MVLKAEIKVQEPLPLKRTLDSIPGQERLLTAKMWADVGKLQYLNCVRTALNASTGLDFSLPSDGPLAERDVSWELVGDASFYGQKSSQTGVYKRFVNLKAPDGAKRDFQQQISDQNGESKMILEGEPKMPSVAFIKSMKVNKSAMVRVSVALKSARDTGQNLIDIGGAAIGIAMGGPIGILSALPELGFRNKRPLVSKRVPVEDRDPCEENWSGTITFKYQGYRIERSAKSTRTYTDRETVTYDILGKEPDAPPNKASTALDDAEYKAEWSKKFSEPGLAKANVSISIANKVLFEGIVEPDPCCPEGERQGGTRIELQEMAGNDFKPMIVRLLSGESYVDFNLETVGEDLSVDGIMRQITKTSGTICKSAVAEDGEKSQNSRLSPIFGYSHTFPINPATANGVETIAGEEKVPFGAGEVLITWDLSRCK